MEPTRQDEARIQTRYIVHTKVQHLREHRAGWFVTFEGSSESLYLGPIRPPFEENDPIRITIEKETGI